MLPDLGTYMLATAPKSKVIVLFNCETMTINTEDDGFCQVVFKASLDEVFLGSIFIKGSVEKISKIIKKTIKKKMYVDFIASYCVEKSFVSDDGQKVVPFIGEIVR